MNYSASMSHSNQIDNDRLFIFSVRIPLRDGKTLKSSVSMDGFLAECLVNALGNHAEASKWVECRAIKIREDAQNNTVIRRVGVSRLVQREALKLVLKKACTQ